MVGLGLMKVCFRDLPQSCKAILLRSIRKHFPNGNIFLVHNVLWGLAQMRVTVDELSTESSESDVNDHTPDSDAKMESLLAYHILNKTISSLHTFLPEQVVS